MVVFGGADVGILTHCGDAVGVARVGFADSEVADVTDEAKNVVGDDNAGEIDVARVGDDILPFDRVAYRQDRPSLGVSVFAVGRLLDVNARFVDDGLVEANAQRRDRVPCRL